MLQAGVPLGEAMDVAAAATNNRPAARQAVRGAGGACCRARASPGHCADSGSSRARPADAAGRRGHRSLDDQLDAVAAFYERELDYKVKQITTLMEPAVLVVMGVIVGFVALALVTRDVRHLRRQRRDMTAAAGPQRPGLPATSGLHPGRDRSSRWPSSALGVATVVGGMMTSITGLGPGTHAQAEGQAALRAYAEAVAGDAYSNCAASYPAAGFSAAGGLLDGADGRVLGRRRHGFACHLRHRLGLQRVTLTVTADRRPRRGVSCAIAKRRHDPPRRRHESRRCADMRASPWSSCWPPIAITRPDRPGHHRSTHHRAGARPTPQSRGLRTTGTGCSRPRCSPATFRAPMRSTPARPTSTCLSAGDTLVVRLAWTETPPAGRP